MPFKSLGVVSYSPSIVAMTVSAVILDIFSVKEYPDLENTVRVYSRSLEMALELCTGRAARPDRAGP